jgi:hypothetical protein
MSEVKALPRRTALAREITRPGGWALRQLGRDGAAKAELAWAAQLRSKRR